MSRSIGFLVERRQAGTWQTCRADALLAHRGIERLTYAGYSPSSPVYTLTPSAAFTDVLRGDSLRPPLGRFLPDDLSKDALRELKAMADPAYGEPGCLLAADMDRYDWKAISEEGEPSPELHALVASLKSVMTELGTPTEVRLIYFFS